MKSTFEDHDPTKSTNSSHPTEQVFKHEATREGAACVIQKTYRGYRTRRQLQSFNIEASTRWLAAVREVKFRQATRPLMIRASSDDVNGIHELSNHDRTSQAESEIAEAPHERALARWKRATASAQRATSDPGASSSEVSSSRPRSSCTTASSQPSGACRQSRSSRFCIHLSSAKRAECRRRRAEDDAERRQKALMMKMDYFLEMIDPKHRYGSSLRAYHAVWLQSDTHQNFFYWLDHGDGRELELEGRSRDRLEREQIRYLSRDERTLYMVVVDNQGRLCWAKNGRRISTSRAYKDSIRGIVPIDDPTPEFVPESLAVTGQTTGMEDEAQIDAEHNTTVNADSSHRISHRNSSMSSRSDRGSDHYPTPKVDHTQEVQQETKISASTIFNHLLRRTARKDTWIFVADTQFRLYIGIKQSGAFQHSSFLQGSRISAAGSIKVSDGRLKSLSPLSGHYRPPPSSFGAFVSSLRAMGVDLSRVSLSKAYIVIIGLEAYIEIKEKSRRALGRVDDVTDHFSHGAISKVNSEHNASQHRVG